MAYIGNIPATSFEAVKKDRFTSLTGTSVTLSHAVSTVQDIVLWINAVKQDYTSYSVSGTALTVGGSLVSSDIVEVAYLGRTFQTVNPPAGSVGASQISDGSISLGKLSATGTKSSSTFLRGDNSFQEVPAGGITVADQWRYTGGSTFSTEAVINASWERVDTSGQGTIGSAMTESSGIFTFPSTGVYLINFMCNFYKTSGNTRYTYNQINVTTNNSSYAGVARGYQALYHISSATYANVSTSSLIDVTSTSNVKVSFSFAADSGVVLQGDTDKNFTHINFIRLGDT